MKKIIITGTSKGIGKSIATYLLNKNMTIIGISRRHSIKHKNYYPVTYDLSELNNLKYITDQIFTKHKKIDILISNAGNGIFENIENIPINKINSYFNLNLISHVLLSKLLVPHFKRNKKGQFIFMGSEAATKVTKKSSLYSAAKAGLNGFAKVLQLECNTSNIRVTVINPGMVRSNFFDNLSFKPGNRKENAISKNDLSELVYFLINSSKNINYADISLSPIKKVISFKQ